MITEDSFPSPPSPKRRRLTPISSTEAEAAKARLAAVKEKFGRDLCVFETLGPSLSLSQVSNDGTEEMNDIHEFTAEDHYQNMGTIREVKGNSYPLLDQYLCTRKIREAEAARRSKMTVAKAKIRIRFPDNHTLEVAFDQSEKIKSLFDLLVKVVAGPELPFYLYTTPPKKQIKDLSQDFYSAGFVPGAIVYFSYDLPTGDCDAAVNSGPFLIEEIMSLKGLDVMSEPAVQVHSEPELVAVTPSLLVQHLSLQRRNRSSRTG